MTTTVTLTGTGTRFPASRRAGPGALVRHGDLALQFDAGRATTLRLAEIGVVPNALTAVFLTHAHSDHVTDLPYLAMTRWLFRNLVPAGPLPVVVPAGQAADSVATMLEPYAADIASRRPHLDAEPPEVVALSSFAVPHEPAVVWHSADQAVTVRVVAVRHEPVKDAVAYRIDTPDAAVVVSGDTRVGAEIEDLARGADLLVHEQDLLSGGCTRRTTVGRDLLDFPISA
jgi:ribonuclease Z